MQIETSETEEANPYSRGGPPNVPLEHHHRRRRLRRVRAPEPRPEQCHNCGFRAGDHNFCPSCGQENRKPKTSLTEVSRDFWEEFVRVDSKLFQTLIALICHPGRLTVDYIAGKRVRYITPFRLYLTVSFLFFLVFSYSSTSLLTSALGPGFLSQSVPDAFRSFQHASGKTDVEDGDKSVKVAPVSSKPHIKAQDAPASFPTLGEYNKEQQSLPLAERDQAWKHWILERMIESQNRRVGDVVSALVTTISRMMFVLLPVYAILLKLLYWRRKRSYVEHFVYALHVNTAWYVLLLIYLICPLPFEFLLLAIGFITYKILAMRRVYGQSIPKTIAKLILLYGVYNVALLVGTLLAVPLAFIL